MTTIPDEPVPDLGLICDVCGIFKARGVYSVPSIPVSCAYCDSCLRANAHPYDLLVTNVAVSGGDLEEMAMWFRQMVHDTLKHLGKSKEKFLADVATAVEDFNNALKEEQEKEEKD